MTDTVFMTPELHAITARIAAVIDEEIEKQPINGIQFLTVVSDLLTWFWWNDPVALVEDGLGLVKQITLQLHGRPRLTTETHTSMH